MENRIALSLPPDAPGPLGCSWCGKDKGSVKSLWAGSGGIHICNECIELMAAVDPAVDPQPTLPEARALLSGKDDR